MYISFGPPERRVFLGSHIVELCLAHYHEEYVPT